MNGNRIIVHTLIKCGDGYLVTKRAKEETAYQEYWDTPGGMVELGEFPKEAVIRETKEETGLDVIPIKAIHEDSDYDAAKDMIFVRLVYLCELKSDIKDIVLQKEEHTEYRIIKSIKDLAGEKLIPYLIEILNDIE